MAQRQVINSAMDTGRGSFGGFLDNHFSQLKQDLLKECERIASARELLLKRQLYESRTKIADMQEQIRRVTQQSGHDALQVVLSPGEDSITNSLDPKDIANTRTANIDPGQLEQSSPEDADLAPSTSHASEHERFAMWGEWKGLVASSSRFDSNTDRQMQEETVAFDDFAEVPSVIIVRKSSASCCTISPNSNLVICWEVFGIPVLFYDLVMIPMQVFHKFKGVFFDTISWVLILYWTADLLFRMLVFGSLDSDGNTHLKRKDFMKTYMRKSFAFDFLMVAPDWFSKVVGTGGTRNVAVLRLLRILRLMRLMRMTKMKRLFRNLEDAIDSEYFTVGVSICVNLFAILGMCHYLACFWFWLGSQDFDGEPTWVDVHIQNFEWQHQYVISLHWAIAQFTPGASKIQPVNIVESGGSILVLIFGLIFLSLFISALSQARTRLQAMTSKVDRDNWMLRRYLRQQGVSMELQVRTLRYVEKCVEPMFARIQRKDVFLLPLLSRPLQLEVQEEQYFHTLIAHPLLARLRERSMALTLQLFMHVIVEILLADSDLLFEVGSISHEMYFVSRGELRYLQHGGKTTVYVDPGGWCSEAVLWVEWVHKGTAKAEKDCTVISMDSAKLRSAVLEHKERTYVSKCAAAYHKDVNQGDHRDIDDLTRFTDDDSSAYMQAIHVEPSVGHAPSAVENGSSSAKVASVSSIDLHEDVSKEAAGAVNTTAEL